jgi:hypothetical protein
MTISLFSYFPFMTEAVLAIIKITIRQEATIYADPAKESKAKEISSPICLKIYRVINYNSFF